MARISAKQVAFCGALSLGLAAFCAGAARADTLPTTNDVTVKNVTNTTGNPQATTAQNQSGPVTTNQNSIDNQTTNQSTTTNSSQTNNQTTPAKSDSTTPTNPTQPEANATTTPTSVINQTSTNQTAATPAGAPNGPTTASFVAKTGQVETYHVIQSSSIGVNEHPAISSPNAVPPVASQPSQPPSAPSYPALPQGALTISGSIILPASVNRYVGGPVPVRPIAIAGLVITIIAIISLSVTVVSHYIEQLRKSGFARAPRGTDTTPIITFAFPNEFGLPVGMAKLIFLPLLARERNLTLQERR